MKTTRWFIGLLLLTALFTVAATNGVPVPNVDNAPLPVTASDFWAYGIAIVVPLVVGLFKKLVPRLPTWLLPISSPFVGLAIGALLKLAGAQGFGWWDSALAGAAGVMLREGWNQVVTQNVVGVDAAKTKGPEDK